MAVASNPLDSFIWGAGGAQLTPEEIARQREIAAALLGEPDFSPVGHWTQGAARVVSALGGVLKDRRADSAEASNIATNSGLVERLLGGMGGQSAPMAAAAPATDYASDRVAQAHGAEPIRQGLIARGLPEHVADAFVMNFQDESGLNPGINEANPTVPGSRGGFGLYQLTGPRRRAYEAYAAERGVDPADTDAQLDFLMLEGQGPEKAAFDAILAAPDTGTAAAAIVNKFLRPAEEHRASREARYLKSGGGTQVASLDPAIGIGGATIAPQEAREMLASRPADASPYSGPGQTIDPRDLERLNSPVDPLAQTLMRNSQGEQLAVPPPEDMALKGDRLPAVAQALMGQQGVQPAPAAPMPSSAADRPVSLPAPQRAPVAAPAPMAASGGGMGGINPAIIEALSNPAASEQTRKIAGILLGQQLEQNDPMRALEMDYKRAQIGALGRKGTGEDETFFGNPVAIQGPDGNISYGQMGNRGTFRPIQLPQGQTFAPPTKTIDTGTETLLLDQAGNVIARTPKQNYQEAFDKGAGAAAGKTSAETSAEYSSIKSKMPGLYSVVDRLQGLAKTATYTMAGKMLDATGRELGAEPREGAVARAEYTAIIDNQILPLLRDTFGAQFTAEEGQRLARTLGDPDKSPTEKSALLRAFIEQKERDLAALESRIGGGSPGPVQNGQTPSFTDQRQVIEAIQNGTLKIGDEIMFNGERMRVDP